mmetsp:Transcript_22445/g.33240  ORF Transcript_22445/g.33240 Transcript_22445/m.33240 type:complete len:224 (-) Transcript_22445:706-1377(-)
MNLFFVCQVSSPLWKQINVIVQHQTKRSIVNLHMRTMGKEIVTHYHTHEHKIVNDTIIIILIAKRIAIGKLSELNLEHLPQNPFFQEFKIVPRVLQHILLLPMLMSPSTSHNYRHFLSQQHEVRFMRHQSQHDQICIQSIQNMSHIWFPMRMAFTLILWVVLSFTISDVIHNLMLPLTRNIRTREYNICTILPKWISLLFEFNPFSHCQTKLEHEICSGRNTV